MGRFYSDDNLTKRLNEDTDRHYAELLSLYGDADEWARTGPQETNKTIKYEVKILF